MHERKRESERERHVEGCCGRHGVPTIWAFCGVRGATPAHVLFEVGGALVSRAVFRVLLGRFSKKKNRPKVSIVTTELSDLSELHTRSRASDKTRRFHVFLQDD